MSEYCSPDEHMEDGLIRKFMERQTAIIQQHISEYPDLLAANQASADSGSHRTSRHPAPSQITAGALRKRRSSRLRPMAHWLNDRHEMMNGLADTHVCRGTFSKPWQKPHEIFSACLSDALVGQNAKSTIHRRAGGSCAMPEMPRHSGAGWCTT